MAKSPEILIPKKGEITKSPEAKKRLSKKAIIARLAGTLFLIANAAVGVKYHVDYDVPVTPAGIVEDITHIPQEWLLLAMQGTDAISHIGQKEAPVPLIYDNSVDKQAVQAGINAVPISKEELVSLLKDTIKPIETGSFPKVSMIMPIELSKDQRIEVSTKYVSQVFNPITGIIETVPGGKNFLIPNKDTEIIVPVEGAEIFLLKPYVVRGQPYFNGILIQFNGPDETRYSISIRTPDDIRQLLPMDIIKDAQEQKAGSKGIPVPAGTPILKTTMNNANIKIGFVFSSPQYSQPGYCGFDLITDNQEQKVLYISPSANN